HVASAPGRRACLRKSCYRWKRCALHAPAWECRPLANRLRLVLRPALSYVGNEVVGLAYTDLYSGEFFGLGDSNGQAYAFCSGPCGPNSAYGATNNSPLANNFYPLGGSAVNNQAASMYGWSSIGSSNYNALQATLSKRVGRGVQFDLNYTY